MSPIKNAKFSLTRWLKIVVQIILFLTSLNFTHLALGEAAPLCGALYNVSGVNKIEKMILKSTSDYPLPRDPFGLQMFDIEDKELLLDIEANSNIDWEQLLLESSFARIKSIQDLHISICLKKFESINIRSSGSLFLSVRKAFDYKVWQNGELLIAGQRP